MVRSKKFLATLAAMSFVLAACGGGSSDGGEDGGGETESSTPIETVDLTFQPITAGKLTVCSDAPYEPFEFQDESGKWTGFDMDLMTAVATRYGLTLEVSVQPFDGIWLAPKAGTCDVVASSMTITEERAKNAAFTDPYFDSYQSLLVREADAETLNGLEALDGKKVGVQTGTTGEAFAKENAPTATIQTFDDAAAMFLALESNQIDAIIQDFPINAYRAVKQGGTVVSASFQDETEQYGFAVAPENEALLLALNESLNEFRATGVYQEIFDKYFGETAAE